MAEPPRRCNAAAWFVDRHVAAARGDRTALVADGRPLAYRTVFENVNRTGHALRRLGVGMGDRVLLLLPDVPEFAYGFWGALKLGAVPIPTNTLLTPRDYEYILTDSGAVAASVSAWRLSAIAAARPPLGSVRHITVVGGPAARPAAGRRGPAKRLDSVTRGRPTLYLAVPRRCAALLQVPDAARHHHLRPIAGCLPAGEPLPKPLHAPSLAQFGVQTLDEL